MAPLARIRAGLLALALVLVLGSLGYLALGFSPLDSVYQTVTTVTTVGFREVEPMNSAVRKIYTIVLVLVGVGTAFYTFGVALEALVEGHLRTHLEARRMQRELAALRGHVIVCGWGRVGRAVADAVARAGTPVVVIDRDPERIANLTCHGVVGDVTDDAVLEQAGIMRAAALVAALETDADNTFVTLSGRALRPDLVIIARARTETSEPKLVRAGANHVVNPQRLGGGRMAAFAIQPHVMDFLDVVMHDGSVELRMEEAPVGARGRLSGRTVAEADVQHVTGALLLAIRTPEGRFVSVPDPETRLTDGHVLIAIGSATQLAQLRELATVLGPDAQRGVRRSELERGQDPRHLLGELAREKPQAPDLLGQPVTGLYMQMHGEHGRLLCRRAAGSKPGDDA